jgi:outer membrane protein assembly factor BamB
VTQRGWLSKGATGLALGCALLLSACSSTPGKPQPGPLPAVSAGLSVSKTWTARLGEVSTPLQAAVIGNRVVLASSDGQLAEIDATSGRELWRRALGETLLAGVGSDGKRHAVITAKNELVVLQSDRELWRQRLAAQTFTAPLVAGERVFVQTADRSVTAYDGASGQRLWALQRNADPLVLRQAGVLTAWGDTLLAGNGGRLSAIQPVSGQVRWDVVVGSSRGTNEVERLVDLVAGISRQGQILCVRSFQTAVGCVDAEKGATLWSRPSQGHQGVDGDEVRVFGVESDSKLRAWFHRDGQPAWSEDQYRFRGLTAPRVWGVAVAFGDSQGWVHLLSREQGRTLQRVATDGSPVALQPVVAGQTLVTVNRSGLVTGWRAD